MNLFNLGLINEAHNVARIDADHFRVNLANCEIDYKRRNEGFRIVVDVEVNGASIFYNNAPTGKKLDDVKLFWRRMEVKAHKDEEVSFLRKRDNAIEAIENVLKSVTDET